MVDAGMVRVLVTFPTAAGTGLEQWEIRIQRIEPKKPIDQ
jgi:hypothetical protein